MSLCQNAAIGQIPKFMLLPISFTISFKEVFYYAIRSNQLTLEPMKSFKKRHIDET